MILTLLKSFRYFSLSCLLIYTSVSAQTDLARFTVHAGQFDRRHTIVHADLNGIDLGLSTGSLQLYEVSDGRENAVVSQLDMDDGPKLWWMITDKLNRGESRDYLLKHLSDSDSVKSSTKYQISEHNGNLIIHAGDKKVLQYNLQESPLPEGVSDLYNRAGYIHPIWSPQGEQLTRIQPPDHYHHVGLWNPWTHTFFKGKEIDFWNLNKAEGTVRPVTVTSKISNDLFAGFSVIHDHIDLRGQTRKGYEVALKEEWKVRAWEVEDVGFMIDFISILNNPTDSLFTVLEYRYQGFGFRATEKWDDQTATLLTSEGKDKADGNSTRARWCDVNGISNAGTSGILFITHPSNYNYPEPIRIWPVGANNGKENVFFNFNPAMDRDWVLHPGRDYQLKYRMFVYDGKISPEKAEALWQDFTNPPVVSVEIVR